MLELTPEITPVLPRLEAGLLTGQDFAVAAWTWKAFGLTPMFINRAFGIMDEDQLVGAAIFHNYNGVNVEFSYYAPHAPTVRQVRFLACFALCDLRVERVTCLIPRNRRRLGRQLLRAGAKVEGTLWRYYGREAVSRNAAVQYVLFSENLVRIAGVRRARMN